MNKTTVSILVILALLVGGVAGFALERSRATMKMEDYKMVVQKQLDDAKMALSSATKQLDSIKMQASVVSMSKGVLVATNGMTLYTFDKDTKDMSNCTGTCLVNWPAYEVSGDVPATLPEHLTAFKRADSKMQYAWDGKPLYFYKGDKAAGDTTGDGVGGVWHVVK